MSKIHVLPDIVVSQIAAGEVVERPASVVKELLENALDASATTITVQIEQGGRRRIRVSDDGIGIPADEVELAFTRHATSKLNSIDDLQQLYTLGFRGEALASIAAISHITITTRHRDEETGTRLRIEGGKVLQRQEVGAPAGTVLDVENLFFNTPARLKFLKKTTTEKRHITSLVSRYAMAYPHVRFVLEQDSREILRTTGSGELADVVVRVLGLDAFRQMIPIAGEERDRLTGSRINVHGYVALPDFSRADRSHITLFVNGRSIQDTRLTYALTQAYQGMLDDRRYPVAIVMIDLPPDDVDVNVHPTKAEVRFRSPDTVFTAVQRSVRQALLSALSAHPSESSTDASPAQQTLNLPSSPAEWQSPPSSPPPAYAAQRPSVPLAQTTRHSVYTDDDADLDYIPAGADAPLRPRTLPILRVIGQIGAQYIVAEGPVGMYLIDQNAAHERILYQALHEQLGSDENDSIEIEPQTIELPKQLAKAFEQSWDFWHQLGFVIEPFGPDTWIVRAVPSLLQGLDIGAAILYTLKGGSEPEQLIRQLSAFAAIRSGEVLSTEEMRSLIQQLERCPSPMTAPDGRPTLLHFSSEQIAREFRR